jgi:hypothetical protein
MMQTSSPTAVIGLLMWVIVPAPLAQVQLVAVVQLAEVMTLAEMVKLAEVSNIFLIRRQCRNHH